MSASAWIWLRDLRLPWARVGVHAHEQGIDQPLLLQLGLAFDIAAAAAADDIALALDWSAVEAHVVAHLRLQHYRLIETFAYTLAHSLLATYPNVRCVEVQVEKTGCLRYGSGVVTLKLPR